jgi:hypothetical protein
MNIVIQLLVVGATTALAGQTKPNRVIASATE